MLQFACALIERAQLGLACLLFSAKFGDAFRDARCRRVVQWDVRLYVASVENGYSRLSFEPITELYISGWSTSATIGHLPSHTFLRTPQLPCYVPNKPTRV